MLFTDRADAGRRLAQRLSELPLEQPVVLGLPRGGVPVAAEVATRLQAPLDVLVVRKLGCPWQPELGMGAIGEGGERVLNRELIAMLHLSDAELEAVARKEQHELHRRVHTYRQQRPPAPVAGRTAIVVDDGLATGFTARAAIAVLRHQGARRVVLAVPVAPADTVAELRDVADEVVCLHTPTSFAAIGASYDDFRQVTDEEVRRLLAASAQAPAGSGSHGGEGADPVREVAIPVDGVSLPGTLACPADPAGVVIFAHGSGSSRFSPRNRAVAAQLGQQGFATVLFDLLTPDEERDRRNVFDVALLADRLIAATRWAAQQPDVGQLPVGYFGASTGAAAALHAAAALGERVAAVVCRGGRPDLAEASLPRVAAATLLIVGGDDDVVLALNRDVRVRLGTRGQLEVIAGATHLFQEPGALEAVTDLAAGWFTDHLASSPEPPAMTT